MPNELEQLFDTLHADGMRDHPDLDWLLRLHREADRFLSVICEVAVNADRKEVREALCERGGVKDAVEDGLIALTVACQRWAEGHNERRHGGRLDFQRWAREE
jgi:hypothetical protein